MSNQVNERNPKIYYRPLRKWIDVTPEQKRDWERFVTAIRIAHKRDNTCHIPYQKSYKCDGLYETCEYRSVPETAVKHLSIESELEYAFENGNGKDSFLASDTLTTTINIDSMVLFALLTELKDSDMESYQILMLIAEGLSERACAERMNMPRNTFVYKRDKLLSALRKKF